MSSSTARDSTFSFEQVLAQSARIESLRCVRVTLADDKAPLVISSSHRSWNHAMHFACSDGGIRFDIERDWEQRCRTLNATAENINEDVSACRRMKARRIELTSSFLSMDCEKLTLQSTVDPLEIHSLNRTKNGIALRCPKGGVVLRAGASGLHFGTTGDIELNLDVADRAIYLCRRGTRRNYIHIGNDRSETVVYNRLIVRGKLILADDAVVEKNISTTRIVDNVVRLTSHDTAVGYHFGLVAQCRRGVAAGLVYDPDRRQFYLASHLGEYARHRFAPPIAYAELAVGALNVQEKVQAPFVSAQGIQCRTLRSGTQPLSLHAPTVVCSHALTSTSVATGELRADRADCAEVRFTQGRGKNLDAETVSTTALVLGAAQVDKLVSGVIGPHGMFRTLQDALDWHDAREQQPSDGHDEVHLVFEGGGEAHNVTATVRCARLVLDARHARLVGTLEISHECATLHLVDARLDGVALVTHEEHRQPYAATRMSLRNVSGTARDWSFDVPRGALELTRCDVEFVNPILGVLQSVTASRCTFQGTPWLALTHTDAVTQREVIVIGRDRDRKEGRPTEEEMGDASSASSE